MYRHHYSSFFALGGLCCLKRQCRGPLPMQQSKDDDKDGIRSCSLVKRGAKKCYRKHLFSMFFNLFKKK